MTVNAVGPGYIATNFGFNDFCFIPDGITQLLIRVYGRVGTSAQEGAQTCIYFATSPEVENVTGEYFEKEIIVPSSEDSYDTVDA